MTHRQRTFWQTLFRRNLKKNRANRLESQSGFLRPLLEHLEDRRMLATFAGTVGNPLEIDLNTASTDLVVVAGAANYSLTLFNIDTWTSPDIAGGATVSTTNHANDTLTVTKDFFSALNIGDTAAGDRVFFHDSGANPYTDFLSGVSVFGSITATGSGSIDLMGTGGGDGSHQSEYGVLLSNSVVQVNTGSLGITGTAGSGTNFGIGVYLNYFADVSVLSTGSAPITITGAGDGTNADIYAAVQAGNTHTIGGGSATGPVNLIANNAVLYFAGQGTVNVQTSDTVTIRQRTNNTPINLGGNDVIGATPRLGLNDAELDRITAARIVVGHANAGDITFSAAIDLANSNTLETISGGDITQAFTGTALAGDTLIMKGDLAPGLTGIGTFTVDGPATFDGTASYEINLNGPANYDQLVVAGNTRVTTLNDAELFITLDTVPVVGSHDVFRIVDSTGTGSTLSGQFKYGGVSLIDGAEFTVGSTDLTIHYLANGDVTLTESGNTPPTQQANTGITVDQASGNHIIGQSALEFTDAEQSASQLTYTLDLVGWLPR